MPLVRRSHAALATAAAAALIGVLGSAAAGDGLVMRTSKEAGFSVKLPATWRYRNATYPSDHSTEFWTSPGDARSKLKVEVSACVGCVVPSSCILENKGCRPAPEQVVPAKTLSKTKLDRWRMKFVARSAGTPYPDRGLVVITHDGEDITGFALVQLWLPASQLRLADTILASFRI